MTLEELTEPASGILIGYVSLPAREGLGRDAFQPHEDVISRACEEHGIILGAVVFEREPENGKWLPRYGLRSALERIAAGGAQGLVVSELGHLTRSAAELGALLGWFIRVEARFIAVAQELDTDYPRGRLAVQALADVSGWERDRLSQRTRNGLQAARDNGRHGGRPAVADYPELSARIVQMRTDGMTLQAISDRLNQEGVPTVRGGAIWRPSSVQRAAGHVRRDRAPVDILASWG